MMVSPTRSTYKDRIRIFADMFDEVYRVDMTPVFPHRHDHPNPLGAAHTRSLAMFPSSKQLAENGLEFYTQVNSAVLWLFFKVRVTFPSRCNAFQILGMFKQSLEAVTVTLF